MATTSPTRVDDDLYASAKLVGEVMSRSAAQQLAHWARIGRELEASGTVSHQEIGEVLVGSRSYDNLRPREQAVVRAEWAERMTVMREGLDLAAEFAGAGETYSELGPDGQVVHVDPAASAPRRRTRPPATRRRAT